MHTEITLYCIEKGVKCVWCEKPAVASMSGGDAMLAAAAARDTLLVINHNRRWENVYRRLRKVALDAEVIPTPPFMFY